MYKIMVVLMLKYQAILNINHLLPDFFSQLFET